MTRLPSAVSDQGQVERSAQRPLVFDQARVVARGICGRPEPYEDTPWFWSNQYDLRLQTVGLNQGFEETIVRGEPASRSFSVAYLREGRLVALDCVNAVRD